MTRFTIDSEGNFSRKNEDIMVEYSGGDYYGGFALESVLLWSEYLQRWIPIDCSSLTKDETNKIFKLIYEHADELT